MTLTGFLWPVLEKRLADMAKERFKLIPTSHLVLIKDGKILLLRRFNTGWMDGNYSVVAGHLDGGETFIQAMIREANEEAGIQIKPEDLEVIHVVHRNGGTGNERVDVFIKAKKWEGEPKNIEPLEGRNRFHKRLIRNLFPAEPVMT